MGYYPEEEGVEQELTPETSETISEKFRAMEAEQVSKECLAHMSQQVSKWMHGCAANLFKVSVEEIEKNKEKYWELFKKEGLFIAQGHKQEDRTFTFLYILCKGERPENPEETHAYIEDGRTSKLDEFIYEFEVKPPAEASHE